MKSIKTILPLLGLIAFSFPSFSQAGTLDSTFNQDGAAFFYFQGGSAVASAITVLPDEKILVVGTVVTGPGANSDILLLRYNPNGQLDASFGQGGFVLYDRNHQDDVAKAMVVQADGKILIAGWTVKEGKNYGILCRFLPDGDLDKSFGEDGVVYNENELTEFPSTDLFLDSKGRILWCLIIVETDAHIIRYLIDGTIDVDYGIQGEAICDVIAHPIYGFWTILPDDKVIAVSVRTTFNDSGGPDYIFGWYIGFSEDGKTQSKSLQHDIYCANPTKMVAWNNGIAVGNFELSKINYEGKLENEFGFDGKNQVPGTAYSMSGQIDGKLVVSGESALINAGTCFVERLDIDGKADNSFGKKGKAFLNFSLKDDIAYATTIDADDRILLAGQSGDSLMIARLYGSKLTGEPSPGIDSTFFEFRPNPIGDILIADYALPTDGTITIELMDLQGRLTRSFYRNVNRQAGHYVEPLLMDNGLANGVYFLRFRSGEYTELQKLVMTK